MIVHTFPYIPKTELYISCNYVLFYGDTLLFNPSILLSALKSHKCDKCDNSSNYVKKKKKNSNIIITLKIVVIYNHKYNYALLV